MVRAICLIGWFSGDFLSEKFYQNENVIVGNYTSFIADKPVLYVAQGCPACNLAKSFIREHSIDVEIRIINSNPQWVNDLELLGVTSVPVLVQKDKMIIGFLKSNYAMLN